MDRHSNGSFIVKDRIVNTWLVSKMINDVTNEIDVNSEPIVVDKEYQSLKNIDEKMNEIDITLDDIEEK